MILIYEKPELLIDCTACGENCAKWLLEIAQKKDILINLNYFMDFPEPFELKIQNNGAVCHNFDELYRNSIHYVR